MTPPTALLEGKVALVTGGAGAMGQVICRQLARAGAKVYCVDLDATRCDEVTEAIRSEGGDAVSLAGNVGDRESVFAIFDRVRQDGGVLDVIVNTAMWIAYQPIDEIDDESADRMLTIGMKAPIWIAQAAVPLMAGRSASLINISSTAAVRPSARQFVYSGIKGGVHSMTLQSSIELGKHGIRVNAIAPGLVVHAGNEARLAPDLVERRTATTPLGRLGTPEDIAGAVLFLASDLSAFVSGVTITVDGGWVNAQ